MTERDLMRRGRTSVRRLKSHSWRVGDVMTNDVLSVTPETSIGQIADIFLAAEVKCVPVTQEGKLLGKVSRRDLPRATTFASPKHDMSETTQSGSRRAPGGIRISASRRTVSLVRRSAVVSVDTSVSSEHKRRAIEFVVVDRVPGAR